VQFCGVGCQRAAWSSHRHVCKSQGEARKRLLRGAMEAGGESGIVAECMLAAYYRLGACGVERSEAKADELCHKAYLRGFEYEQVEDLPGNEGHGDKACEWYRCAARGGHSHAMWALACCLEREEENSVEALTWLHRAAGAGCPQAQTSLGVHYVKEGDFPSAVNWYSAAAASGDKNAVHNLGLLYATGQGVGEDAGKARALWMSGVAGGNGRCALRLGEMCLKEGEALEAEAGGAGAGAGAITDASTATTTVTTPHHHHEHPGEHCTPPTALSPAATAKFEEATAWFRKAAEGGEGEGHYYLFVAYRTGRGAPQSNEKALAAILAASETTSSAALAAAAASGEAPCDTWDEGEDNDPGSVRVRAAYVLGSVYEMGELGVAVDHDKALDWWTKAAEKNHPCSMVRIGLLLRNKGERTQAEKWFRLAQRLGHSVPGEGETHSH
jgi:TPR repeat protein